MNLKRKKSIIIGSIIIVGLFLSFLIFHNARETSQVEVSQEPSQLIVKDDQTKKTVALKKEAEPKRALPTPSPKKNFTIVIDPGHQQHANNDQELIAPGSKQMKGKVSSGTSGVSTGKPEYELTLEAALILEELLTERGFHVVLTRKENIVDISNKERAEMANEHQADLFIRLHADGSNDSSVKGFHILTPAEGHAMHKQSLQASKAIFSAVQRDRSIDTNGISFRSDITGFNWSQVPTALIEMGFMTNTEDDQKLANEEYLRNLMTSIAEGIVLFRK
ncbi:N-acetylmuramoyl-L-alanine amidase [Bacillus sp. N1-1]|uniref:N-acetylmuramoyl-L-alanine amidase family protein n=1 Tax=Bacillus sp. N1-1 TaxID=2682541 RepID=UPI001319B311|nr:N-acetylmuramoyl-L-alanine amidase [Bacillus sp. N1-1]QHA93709.1 N-acetylmuramoyl-L-alanine amidase [Bacillus sp. N1-1]